jgi:hypothetical protein
MARVNGTPRLGVSNIFLAISNLRFEPAIIGIGDQCFTTVLPGENKREPNLENDREKFCEYGLVLLKN